MVVVCSKVETIVVDVRGDGLVPDDELLQPTVASAATHANRCRDPAVRPVVRADLLAMFTMSIRPGSGLSTSWYSLVTGSRVPSAKRRRGQ